MKSNNMLAGRRSPAVTYDPRALEFLYALHAYLVKDESAQHAQILRRVTEAAR